MKPLSKLISSHLKKFRRHLKLIEIVAAGETIHDLRVEYKKMRALARLAGTSKNKIKIPFNLKELYTAAGRVRELQLQQHIMKEETNEIELPGYFTLIQKQLSFAINTLKEKAGSPAIKDSLHEFENTFPGKISAKQAASFIKEKINALLIILQLKNKKDEDIHSSRKIIKDLMYTFHNLNLLQLSSVINLSAEEEKRFHHLSDELGLFQDQCNALTLLKLSMFRSIPEPEKNMLKQIRAKKMAVKIEERKRVLTELNNSVELFNKLTRY